MKAEINVVWMIFHVIQIVLFQFVAAPRLSQLSVRFLKKRNPELAVEVTGSKTALHSPHIDKFIGVLSVALLLTGFFTSNKTLYWSGKYTSLFGFLLTTLLIDFIRYEKFKKIIPLKRKRSASLVPRKLGRTVPLWAWILNLFVFLGAMVLEADFRKQLFMASIILLLIISAVVTEKKAKISNDVEEDDLYRKSEAWAIFSLACLFPLFLPLKEYVGHYGVDAIFSSAALIAFMLFFNSKIYKKLMP